MKRWPWTVPQYPPPTEPQHTQQRPAAWRRWWLGLVCLGMISLAVRLPDSIALELYLRDGTRWGEEQVLRAPKAGSQPVLFVHGHRTSVCGPLHPLCSCEEEGSDCAHYRRTWMEGLANGLRSFADAIDYNSHLNIEPYYLNFVDNARSIVEDARGIGEAVERILGRHNPRYSAFPFRNDALETQVAIIAYSKGTISTRLYLKSLQTPVYDLPGPSIRFTPVSDFVAIAPPNHGTALAWDLTDPLVVQLWVLAQLPKESVRQLNNGYRGNTCWAFSATPSAIDFIEALNGHPMADTHLTTYGTNGNRFGQFKSEAPGSRKNGSSPDEGTLYVTLFDNACRDGVGCDQPRINDCRTTFAYGSKRQGRSVAINLSPHAVNIPIKQIDGGTNPAVEGLVVHTNIVHHPDTMCKALYTAVYHEADPNLVCYVTSNLPKIPVP